MPNELKYQSSSEEFKKYNQSKQTIIYDTNTNNTKNKKIFNNLSNLNINSKNKTNKDKNFRIIISIISILIFLFIFIFSMLTII